ncbi:MAG: hypothetical protein IJF78_10890 [Clostridia bacterium]|nr:hypothetical protein [Clostridia bacterium]
MNREFYHLIYPIIHSEEYRKTRNCRHHIKGSVYDHSLKVARMCYRHHKRFGTSTPLEELLRGALLHDFYLYSRHTGDSSHRFHGFTHPRCALNNALKYYPDLTKTEQDMILRHMFPLTPVPPSTGAGWLLCFYDKVAAVSDYFGRNKWKARPQAGTSCRDASCE